MSAMRFVKLAGIAVLGLTGLSAFAQAVGSSGGLASAPSASLTSGAAANHAPGSKAADRALAKQVRRALAKSGMVLTDMTVRAKDGEVSLIGSVPTAALVEQAGHVAAGVSGVTSVTNRLTIRIDPRSFNGQGAATGIQTQPVASAHKPE